jgi:hypothetical protein
MKSRERERESEADRLHLALEEMDRVLSLSAVASTTLT